MEILQLGLALELFSGFLGVTLFFLFLKRYLYVPNRPVLWLSVMFLLHGANNILWFVSDIPSVTSQYIAIAGYATYGLIPLFGTLFATGVVRYHKREIDPVIIALSSIFFIVNLIYPPVHIGIEGEIFWIPSATTFLSYVPLMVAAYAPLLLFAAFSLREKNRRTALLSSGFFLIATFESVLEANMLLPLFITNFFEASGLLMISLSYGGQTHGR